MHARCKIYNWNDTLYILKTCFARCNLTFSYLLSRLLRGWFINPEWFINDAWLIHITKHCEYGNRYFFFPHDSCDDRSVRDCSVLSNSKFGINDSFCDNMCKNMCRFHAFSVKDNIFVCELHLSLYAAYGFFYFLKEGERLYDIFMCIFIKYKIIEMHFCIF